MMWMWLVACGMPGLWRWEGCVDDAAQLELGESQASIEDGEHWVLYGTTHWQYIPLMMDGGTFLYLHVELDERPVEPEPIDTERAVLGSGCMGCSGGLSEVSGTIQAERRGDHEVVWLDAVAHLNHGKHEVPLSGRMRLPRCGTDHRRPR
jgi:hypothetical protein